MTSLALVARVRDAPGALERLLGLLRRRALPVDALSVYRADGGALEVALAFGTLRTPAERVEAELETLVDVVSLRRVGPAERLDAREMALARTEGDIGAWPASRHGRLRPAGDGVEVTGSPEEIDRALRLMAERGVLAASARSGAMFPPSHPVHDHETERLQGENE